MSARCLRCVFSLVVVLLCGCAWVEKVKPVRPKEAIQPEAAAEPKPSAPWLTNEWLADADVLIVAPLVIVFYEGTADGRRNADGFWIGSVQGRVAVIAFGAVVACDRVDFSESERMDVHLKIGNAVMLFGRSFELPELDESLADDLPPAWLKQLPDLSVGAEINDIEFGTAPSDAEDEEPEAEH